MNCEAESPWRGAKHAYVHTFRPRLTFLRHYVELETCVCKKFGHDSDEQLLLLLLHDADSLDEMLLDKAEANTKVVDTKVLGLVC